MRSKELFPYIYIHKIHDRGSLTFYSSMNPENVSKGVYIEFNNGVPNQRFRNNDL